MVKLLQTNKKLPSDSSAIIDKTTLYKVINKTDKLTPRKKRSYCKNFVKIETIKNNSSVYIVLFNEKINLFNDQLEKGCYYKINAEPTLNTYKGKNEYQIVPNKDTIFEKVDPNETKIIASQSKKQKNDNDTRSVMTPSKASNLSIENLSVEELKEYLQKFGIYEPDLQKLEDERICGELIFEITEKDLEKMGMKFGSIKLIQRIVDKARSKKNISAAVSRTVNETGEYSMKDENNVLEIDTPQCSNAYHSSNENLAKKRKYDININYTRYGTLKETIKQYSDGKKILETLNNNQSLSKDNLNNFIKIIVDELILVQNDNYPTRKSKIALANAVEEEFPILKVNDSENAQSRSSKPIIDLIKNRVQTLRNKLSQEQKKYIKKKVNSNTCNPSEETDSNTCDLLEETDLQNKIEWMKNHIVSDQTKTTILEFLDKTYPNRIQWINSENPSIKEIFDKYPRLLSYNGNMIDREFQRIHPEADKNFPENFETYVRRILKYVSEHDKNLLKKYSDISKFENDNIKAILILIDLLPVSNISKGKTTPKLVSKGKKSLQNFEAQDLLFRQINDISQIVDEVTNIANSKSNMEPYILSAAKNFFVIANTNIIFLKNFTDAINTLFKIYCVTKVQYPNLLKNFFNFLECFIYNIQDKTPSGIAEIIDEKLIGD